MKAFALAALSFTAISFFTTGAAARQSSDPAMDHGRTRSERDTERENRLVGHADAIGRVGPAGAAFVAGVYARHTFERDEQERFERSYLQGGVGVTLTPGSVEPEVHVEYLPIPLLTLRAELGAIRYTGDNYGLLRFDSKDAAFGSDELSSRKGDERSAWATRAGLSVTTRVRLWRFIAKTTLAADAYDFDDAGPYVYEPEHDTLLSTSDWILSSRSDFLFEVSRGAGAKTLLVGPSAQAQRSIDTELSRTRFGGAIFWVPANEWAGLQRPRLYALAGWNLSDPNRKGEPYATAGFGVDVE